MQKPVPAARGFGFPRFMWRKGCLMRWPCRCRWCSTKISACRTRPSRFTRAGCICRGSSNRLWSPVVDLLKTRRLWIWAMQLLLGGGLAGVALTIPAPHFFQLTLAFFWLLAFSSATHDIAADGFYMLALTEHEQAFFSGIRSTFYRVAMICGQGGLVILAGKIHARTGSFAPAWSMAFALGAGIFLCLGVYHRLVLPQAGHSISPGSPARGRKFLRGIFQNLRRVFPETKNRRAPALFAALPPRRGATGENGSTVPARSS